jgi:hypothetical protein
MPSLFASELLELFAAVSELQAQTYIWAPMTSAADVNAPPIADTSRTGASVMGIFYDKQAKPLIPNGFDPRTDQRPGTLSGTPRIEFLPDSTGFTPDLRAPDLLSSETGNTWRIISVFTTKTGIKVAAVNAV